MPYIEKRSPTPRPEDTTLGKLNGWMQEYLFYLDKESQCAQVDAIIPDWFPLNYVQDGFINLFKFVYNSNYQSVYNEGANRGNQINNEVFGWVQSAKSELTTYTDKARSELQAIINDVKARVGSLDSMFSDAKNRITLLEGKVKEFETKIAEAKAMVDRALADVKYALEQINLAKAKIDKAVADAQNALNKVLAMEGQVRSVLDKATSMAKEIEALKERASDFEKRIRALESGAVVQRSLYERIKGELGL